MSLRRMVVRMLPPRLKDSLKVLIGSATAVDVEAGDAESRRRFSCPVCSAQNVEMVQLPFFYFRELDRNQTCLFNLQGRNAEHRALFLCAMRGRRSRAAVRTVFSNNSKPDAHHLAVLDIAPAPALTRFLRDECHLQVRTADLLMPGVDDVVDITDMRTVHGAGQFDVFICSHVLEHVNDDLAAMGELFRVLKPGGWGIAMVPISLGLEAIHEDPLDHRRR